MNPNTKQAGFFSFLNKDFLGFAASILCAVHCAALPLILTFSTLSGLSFLANHTIEFVFLALSAVFVLWSLVPAYISHHKNAMPLVIGTIGLFIVFGSRFLPHGSLEHVMTAIGGVIIAVSHIYNYRLSKSCC
ncbi:MAG: MerC domain-containing protein [Saprospiraceae bacterium]